MKTEPHLEIQEEQVNVLNFEKTISCKVAHYQCSEMLLTQVRLPVDIKLELKIWQEIEQQVLPIKHQTKKSIDSEYFLD